MTGLESKTNLLNSLNKNYLNIVRDRATVDVDKFGTKYFVLEENISNLTPSEVKERVFKLLLSESGAKYLWACRGVIDDPELGESIRQAIQQARWSFGEYPDSLLGIKNIFLNMSKICESVSTTDVEIIAKNVAIVSAGPSLDDHIESLKNFKGLIVAVDVVMKRLQEEGIKPKICLSTERVEVTSTTLEGVDTSETLLVCPVVVAPQTLAAWEGDVCFYYPELKYADWMPYKVEKLRLGAAVGVAQVGWAYSQIKGAENIYLVGHDYAYAEDGSTHGKGLHEVLGDKGLGNKIKAPGVDGECTTNMVWNTWANEVNFMYEFHAPKAKIYNLSKKGHFLKFTEQISSLPSNETFTQISYNIPLLDKRKRIKKKIKKSLVELNNQLPKNNFNKNINGTMKSLGFLLFLKDWTRYLSALTSHPEKQKEYDRWMYRRFKRTRNALRIVLTKALESLC